ncbi:MAG: aminotransferase class V-fold PLP-dependent enzyme [Candidatus Acidiferrales bacterium]
MIRRRFRVFEKKIYANSCSQGALSDAVELAFADHLHAWHDQGSPWDLWVQQYEELRVAFARLIGAHADEVAIVPSASAAINSIASALEFQGRRKVVLGEFEFPTMGHVWLAQQRRGAQVQFVPARESEIPVENYDRAIDRETLIVPLTHLCFFNGFRSDVKSIVSLAHSREALVMLDDYQDCGTRPIDVKALDVDFYVSGVLKYLLGPSGVAFLYVRRELISTLAPTITGWFAQANPFAFDGKRIDLATTARRFETGTPPIPNICAALASLKLLREIGLRGVAAQVTKTARALLDGARRLNIRVKTPADSVGPLVVLQAKDSDAMLAKLAARNVIGSSRKDGVRISFHVYNTLDDVAAVLEVFKENLDLMVRSPAAASSL